MADDRDLLEQAVAALWNCAKSALTVKPSLDRPYPDAPEWTPYTRWVERPARQAHDLAMVIRKRLKEAPDPETPLSDALHTLGEVQRMAESMAMSGDWTERECGRRVLAAIGCQGDEEPALPVAAELDGPEMPGQSGQHES